MFQIKYQKQVNIKIVRKIERECFAVYETCENDDFWFVYNNNDIIGYCASTQYEMPWVSFLSGCAILPDFRGHGLQSRCIKVREQRAKKLGYTRCVSYTIPSNIYSANNLIKNGYKLYIPPTFWGGKNQLYFQKYIG